MFFLTLFKLGLTATSANSHFCVLTQKVDNSGLGGKQRNPRNSSNFDRNLALIRAVNELQMHIVTPRSPKSSRDGALFELAAAMLALLISAHHGAAANSPSSRHTVDASLTLTDVDGKACRPFDLDSAQAIALIFVLHDCPIANAYAPEIQRIARAYQNQPVRLALVYVDPDLTIEQINQHRKDYGHQDTRAFFDREHQLVRATGAEVTPEAVVVTKDGRIAYRGRISNLYADYGKRRRKATKHDLRESLDAILAGSPVPTPRTEALGCFIPKLDRRQSFSEP